MIRPIINADKNCKHLLNLPAVTLVAFCYRFNTLIFESKYNKVRLKGLPEQDILKIVSK